MTTATATTGPARDNTAFALRLFAWGIVFVTFAFLVENYLVHWLNLPGARSVLSGGGGYLAAGVYVLAGVLALAAARSPSPDGLRGDSARITAIAGYIARAAFWIVLLVGIADSVISFLRVEDLLNGLVGPDLATSLGLAQWRRGRPVARVARRPAAGRVRPASPSPPVVAPRPAAAAARR